MRVSSLAGVTAMILAGGLGTRLRTVVADRPKVMADVLGRPFLAYLLHQLADAGCREAILCTGYLGEQISDFFGRRYRTMRLQYSQERTPLGTGGALRLALPRVMTPAVLVLNGDSYCAADFGEYNAWHQASGRPGSLLLTHVDDTSRYGRVEVDESGAVTSFVEKGAASGPGWINAGVYLFSRGLLEDVSPVGSVSLERDLLPRWISQSMGGWKGPGRFLDIGTPESYAETAAFFAPHRSTKSA
jgi:NDP-sugar pyrophosphorylase family protein